MKTSQDLQPYCIFPLHCTLTHHVISLVSITVVMEARCYIIFLTDYPAPTINNSCSYNDPSDLNAMYYFSWSVDGRILGNFFQDLVKAWRFRGSCYNGNKTTVISAVIFVYIHAIVLNVVWFHQGGAVILELCNDYAIAQYYDKTTQGFQQMVPLCCTFIINYLYFNHPSKKSVVYKICCLYTLFCFKKYLLLHVIFNTPNSVIDLKVLYLIVCHCC